jgi:hypothetical protein
MKAAVSLARISRVSVRAAGATSKAENCIKSAGEQGGSFEL